jgi:hypothetical protein
METMTKRVKLDRTAKEYILDAIDSEGYEIRTETEAEKIAFLADTFQKEYGFAIKRYGAQKALAEWIMGLPSAFNIDFENYKILQIAVEWGSLPKDYTEKQADKILANWFNFISAKTLQLFRKHKITI